MGGKSFNSAAGCNEGAADLIRVPSRTIPTGNFALQIALAVLKFIAGGNALSGASLAFQTMLFFLLYVDSKCHDSVGSGTSESLLWLLEELKLLRM